MVVGNHEFQGSLLEKVALDLVGQLDDCRVTESHALVSFLRFQTDGVEEAPSVQAGQIII